MIGKRMRRRRLRRKLDRWLDEQASRSELRVLAARQLIAPFLEMDGNPLIEVRLVDEALRTGRAPGLGAKKVGQAEKTP